MADKNVGRSQRFCWICGRLVALETCKVDTQGLPVHELCYVAKVASEGGSHNDRALHPARA
jgi:hypothetical protein